METAQHIIQFWFGDQVSNRGISDEKKSVWWSKNDEVDREIKRRFESVTNALLDGELEEIRETPIGLLASIICCDQFPRNMYRGTVKSFAFDNLALSYAIEMVDKGWDQKLRPIYRLFAYLPFEHSEEMAMQEKCLILLDNLRASVDESDRDMFEGSYDFARRHFYIIEQYGRFPHRNNILGRVSSIQELEFLSQPGSSF